MQTVRLLERRPRTLAAKIVEIAEALGLERRLAKDDILAIYMTLAPFGGNLEGLRAASLAYFDKEPTRLSAGRGGASCRHSALAGTAASRTATPTPRARLATGSLSEWPTRASSPPQMLAEARGEPIPTRRLALPFHAPHLARALRDAAPGAAQQRTTIDPLLQRQLEALLRREAASLDGSATLAAMVIENRERRVLAHVGNAEFGAAARRGTLDMTRAVRSPGSALKPFIYGMAFDRLILHPETMIEDRRRYFGDYAPSDFDGSFHGEVSARRGAAIFAQRPGCRGARTARPDAVHRRCAAAGIRLQLPRRAEEPGLAIALGGAGITLTDLATLYVALANGGRVAPLRYRDTDPAAVGIELFGPVAAWYVNDILAGAPPPPGMTPAEARHGRLLSFKTGTSYGYRDAWAVGYDRDVTIAVWVGRPDGTPIPGRSGRLTAAPVMFKIADLLPATDLSAVPAAAAGRHADRRPARSAAGIAASRRRTARRRTQGAILEGRGSFIRRTGRSLPGPDRNCRWRRRAEADSYAGLSMTGRCRWATAGGKPRRTLLWRPGGLGFIRLTVIDGHGRSARATVRLVP